MGNKVLISLFLVFILVSSVMVYAAGSSTRTRIDNNKSDDDKNDSDVPKMNNRTVRELQKIDCDEPENRKDRIKCRLKEHREGKLDEDLNNTIPEVCRGIGSERACIVLYRNLNRCYEMENRAKDHCFKRVIGFVRANLKDENAGPERVQRARDYAVALLYDLEQRIEDSNKNGTISDEDATEIIDLIEEIKKDILEGKGKNEIRPKFQELKKLIRELRRENPKIDLSGCALYFDGCNECQVINGTIDVCTEKNCLEYEKPKCLKKLNETGGSQ